MNGVTLAWLCEIGIITWRSVKRDSRPPIPSELLATFIAFGSLTLIANSQQWNKAANLTAGGLVLATLLNFFDPTTGKPYINNGKSMTPTNTGANNPNPHYHGGL